MESSHLISKYFPPAEVQPLPFEDTRALDVPIPFACQGQKYNERAGRSFAEGLRVVQSFDDTTHGDKLTSRAIELVLWRKPNSSIHCPLIRHKKIEESEFAGTKMVMGNKINPSSINTPYTDKTKGHLPVRPLRRTNQREPNVKHSYDLFSCGQAPTAWLGGTNNIGHQRQLFTSGNLVTIHDDLSQRRPFGPLSSVQLPPDASHRPRSRKAKTNLPSSHLLQPFATHQQASPYAIPKTFPVPTRYYSLGEEAVYQYVDGRATPLRHFDGKKVADQNATGRYQIRQFVAPMLGPHCQAELSMECAEIYTREKVKPGRYISYPELVAKAAS